MIIIKENIKTMNLKKARIRRNGTYKLTEHYNWESMQNFLFLH